MNTIDKLNNTLGYLTAMSFDRPELSNDLVEPLNTLSEAISEVENLSLSGVSQQRQLLKAFADEFNNSTDTYVGLTRIEEVLKAFNCG